MKVTSVLSVREKVKGMSRRLSSGHGTKGLLRRDSSERARNSVNLFINSESCWKGCAVCTRESEVLKYIKDTHPAFAQK